MRVTNYPTYPHWCEDALHSSAFRFVSTQLLRVVTNFGPLLKMAENTGNTQTRKWTCCTSYRKLSSSGMLEETFRDTLVKELACSRFFPIPEALAPYFHSSAPLPNLKLKSYNFQIPLYLKCWQYGGTEHLRLLRVFHINIIITRCRQ